MMTLKPGQYAVHYTLYRTEYGTVYVEATSEADAIEVAKELELEKMNDGILDTGDVNIENYQAICEVEPEKEEEQTLTDMEAEVFGEKEEA